ncbi:MAG: AAA family ATPase [Eubacterium sp.]|nr:AAA family ATPase [Eubacterium sp.]
MRYYKMIIGTNSEELMTNAERIRTESNIRIGGSGYYPTPIEAVNDYLYRNTENHVTCIVFKEKEGCFHSVFSYDEQKTGFQAAYDSLVGLLKETFFVKRMIGEPVEITMIEFVDRLLESKRRWGSGYTSHIADEAHCWYYYAEMSRDPVNLHYEYEERMIADRENTEKAIYDQGFRKELKNIETHKNTPECKGNTVHYIISGRSMEAASDMTGALMHSLLKSHRISTRRMEIISEIEPSVFMHTNHIEDMIENNYGGVVVIDLSEKFGFKPSDYVTTAKYFEKIFRKYRNHCLFVFTYDMNRPGFSYYLLPEIKKYAIPVMLREGKAGRKAAIRYMEALISDSDYAEYADQAEEFMRLFPGSEFSQTDVLMAYEQFESWCLNKNVLKAYDYDFSEGFMLDRDEEEISPYEKLQGLIGLDIVKKKIDSILASDVIEKERKKRKGKDYQAGSMHMIFGGNPGSAKTTVAKLFAGIAKEKGILKSGICVERGGMDLDGMGCVGAIREAFTAAKGGVLFIDEAYAMKSDVAVTSLIQEMENRRDEVIVILAGYNERMKDFMEINEGLKSRIPHWIEFPDYTADELTEIFKYMVRERGFSVTDDAVKEAAYIFEKARNTDNFGNGRYVRNLIDRATENQAVRLFPGNCTEPERDKSSEFVERKPFEAENIVQNQAKQKRGKKSEKKLSEISSIRNKELFLIKREDITSLDEGTKEERPVGTAARELDEMVGLTNVKDVIRKAIARYNLNRLCIDRGIPREKASLHMVFTGNPGTAKTTVARLFAEMLKDEKVLPTGNFVEVGRADLVGDHVGSTAPLVKSKFKEAQGGVLFIDEAYSLVDGYKSGYGDEAINMLVQEMENHRDNVIVVFAGYPEPMKEFLDRNPGMLSRIAFTINFEDYSTDELCEITRIMLSKKQMTATDEAMDKLRVIYDSERKTDDYGNGRFVRKVLEEAEMNLAERIMGVDESEITTELITTIDACDVPEVKEETETKSLKYGFIP